MITYQIENTIEVSAFKKVLIDSTLGERRPIEDEDRLRLMLKNANLIITARDGEQLVGIARSITDFAYCTYLSDLAVIQSYQHKGIGKELIRATKLASTPANLILLSAPKAVGYYPKIGMEQFTQCYLLRKVESLK